MMPQPFTTYIAQLQSEYGTGIAREHAYRPALKTLLESPEPGLRAVNDPEHLGENAPDFILDRGGIHIGFVEAKDITVDLDRLDRQSKAQLERYREALPNLIHTNYLRFRWYVGGELRQDCTVAELKGGRIMPLPDHLGDAAQMLTLFVETVAPTITTPRELAVQMAKMAHSIRDLIVDVMDRSDALKAQMQAFEQTLVPGLNTAQFADMYAQTLAYGLFAARVQTALKPDAFTLQNAFFQLPKTNPFLRRFFQTIAVDLDERVRWQVDALASLLAHADIDSILLNFGRRSRQEDPVVHFYETFLSVYDPGLRERRGVYYTPEPVVSFIVRAVDSLLRDHFGRSLGLADPNTLVLDPATGTGTFLYFTIQHIHDTLAGMGQAGVWNEYVRSNLLPRLFGFELLMAPYAVAHMKLGIQLSQLGYDLHGDQRLGVYLTNTLDEVVRAPSLPTMQFVSDEANEAITIKREKPIMVVLGNPPYSGHSANKTTIEVERIDAKGRRSRVQEKNFIGRLLEDYYSVDGQRLSKKEMMASKWIRNDYIKFIRFGQWRVTETGSGVLAFVTDNGYLDNLILRGMRRQLMQAFTDIYIVNLHGNSRWHEQSPDGTPDENVFNIQQGVCISIFIKDVGTNTPARIHYTDLWGRRETKYKALLDLEFREVAWEDLQPQAPHYFFTPIVLDLRTEYYSDETHLSTYGITQFMPHTLGGPNSHRDHFAIAFDRLTAETRLRDLADRTLSNSDFSNRYNVIGNRDWNVAKARSQNLANEKPVRCLYRPFDLRYMLYGTYAFDYPRTEVNRHLVQENLGLISPKQTKDEFSVLVTNIPVGQHKLATTYDGSFISPLYLYPDPNSPTLLNTSDWELGKNGRVPNLSRAFVTAFAAQLGLTFITDGQGDLIKTFGPEDVLHYAYAVFHSSEYRARYDEFLRIDFPRLPLTNDLALFRTLCGLGARLVSLHLLRGTIPLITRFPHQGTNRVDAKFPTYDEKTGGVQINATQAFEGISAHLWETQVGGYAVLKKWLTERRGRTLQLEDILHFQTVVAVLDETTRIVEVIDEATPVFPLPVSTISPAANA